MQTFTLNVFFLARLVQPNAYFCKNPKQVERHHQNSRGKRHNQRVDIHKTHTHEHHQQRNNNEHTMSYKPHLQSLVDDLKSNPSLIHDPSFRALKALLQSEYDAKFPQQKQEEQDDEKNDAKNEEQQEREENDAVHIDDPDVVGPESEPVPEENALDPNKQLTDEEANLVSF